MGSCSSTHVTPLPEIVETKENDFCEETKTLVILVDTYIHPDNFYHSRIIENVIKSLVITFHKSISKYILYDFHSLTNIYQIIPNLRFGQNRGYGDRVPSFGQNRGYGDGVPSFGQNHIYDNILWYYDILMKNRQYIEYNEIKWEKISAQFEEICINNAIDINNSFIVIISTNKIFNDNISFNCPTINMYVGYDASYMLPINISNFLKKNDNNTDLLNLKLLLLLENAIKLNAI